VAKHGPRIRKSARKTAACSSCGRKHGVRFCLAVGGFDPSGGAGVLADVAAIVAAGARALAAVTTTTVQTHAAFLGAEPVSPRLLERQLAALLATYRPRAAKTGALPTAEHVRVVARLLGKAHIPLVVDPVLGASHGPGLVDRSVGREIMRRLLPVAALITPNAAEASALTGLPVRDARDAERAGKVLLAAGPAAVLVKGGHLPDGGHVLVTGEGTWLVPGGKRQRLPTHGSGCTLAAGIAGALAAGRDLPEAIVWAQQFVIGCFELAARRRGPWGPDPLAAVADAAAHAFALD